MINKIKVHFLSFFLKLFLNCIFLTCNWKIVGVENFNYVINKNRPVLLCFWHTHLVCVSRYFKKTPLNLFGVSSTHNDSEILAKILSSWKISLIRGSSTRGWSSVLKKMMALFKDPSTIIALTNDGPKGPPFIAKEGSLSIAKKYNALILSVVSKPTGSWVLPTWDKTIVPKPFSTIYVQFSEVFSSDDEINSANITNFINSNTFD